MIQIENLCDLQEVTSGILVDSDNMGPESMWDAVEFLIENFIFTSWTHVRLFSSTRKRLIRLFVNPKTVCSMRSYFYLGKLEIPASLVIQALFSLNSVDSNSDRLCCLIHLSRNCRDGGQLSTRDLQKMVQALPQYSEQIEKLSLHVDVSLLKISLGG